MKCDVCLTKIPLGQNECPNCGYLIKPVHTNSYDADSKNHEHIKTNTNYLKSRTKKLIIDDHPTMKQHKTIINGKTQNNSFIVKFFIVFFFGISCFSFIIPAFHNVIDFNFNVDDEVNIDELDDLSFQQVIDQNKDDGTVELSLESENELVDYLNYNNYTDINVNEYCYYSGYDQSIRTSFNIDANKNNIHYYITVAHADNALSEKSIVFSGNYDKNINISNFNLKKGYIKDICEHLELYDAFQTLKECHTEMKKEDDEYKYSNYDDAKIYMSEQYHDSSLPYYSFYYSYGETF